MSDYRPGLMSQSAPSTSAIASMASVVSRFAWLWLACGLMLVVSSHARGEESSTTGIKSVPDVIVYRGRYPGWPGLSGTRGGKLVCVWREGDKHMFSAEGRLMLSESDDQGRTWTDGRTFHDEPGVDDRNAGILAFRIRIGWFATTPIPPKTYPGRVRCAPRMPARRGPQSK